MLEPDFNHIYDCPVCEANEAVRIFGVVQPHEGPVATDYESACGCEPEADELRELEQLAEEEELYQMQRRSERAASDRWRQFL